MAAGDNLRNQGISIIEAGGSPTWTPTVNQSKWAKEENNSNFYYFDGTAWQLIALNFNTTYTGSVLPDGSSDLAAHLQALESAIENITNDGNAQNIVRTDAIEDVAPTTAEIATPESGDTANVSLTSQKVEYWSYNGTTWNKDFVVDYSQITIPIQTVSNTNSVNLTITTNDLTADVRLDATQDNYLQITESTAGLRITAQTLTSFSSFALAQASSLAVGDAFILTINNLEGIPSDGVTGPIFRKQ